jgi:hypothetical protein
MRLPGLGMATVDVFVPRLRFDSLGNIKNVFPVPIQAIHLSMKNLLGALQSGAKPTLSGELTSERRATNKRSGDDETVSLRGKRITR